MTRDKNVIKPAKGTRKCNCKNKMTTKQIGPGMFQQFQTQVHLNYWQYICIVTALSDSNKWACVELILITFVINEFKSAGVYLMQNTPCKLNTSSFVSMESCIIMWMTTCVHCMDSYGIALIWSRLNSSGAWNFEQECEDCPNVKYARETNDITVEVDPGMKDGQEITFFEEGEPVIDGDPGDLKVWLSLNTSETFFDVYECILFDNVSVGATHLGVYCLTNAHVNQMSCTLTNSSPGNRTAIYDVMPQA